MKFTAVLLLSLVAAAAQNTAPAKRVPVTAMSKDVMLTPDTMQWMPAPAATGMPSAVQVSVLSGDPSKAGPFVLRLKIPAGGKVAAHWHPTDENVTVLQGTFAAGMGDKFSEADLHDFPAGSYVLMPRTMHHFAMAKEGEVIVQVHAQGPFVLNYVDPADDPRTK
jgi:anti-sigma factor ChrR (cupin superfamily)